MNRIDQLFTELRAQGRRAFMPFVTAGVPDLAFTDALLGTLEQVGANMVELGVPYSDPIADGPVIQESYTRALEGGIALDSIFEMVRRWRTRSQMPLVTMVSYSIVYRHGLEAYVREAIDAGVDGAIIPDLPVEEAEPIAQHAQALDFKLIHLITPTTPRERAQRIARRSTGFIYYVSVTGITGERDELPADLVDQVAWLRGHTDVPVCIGFGISRASHVRMLRPVADGVIVGSAIMRRINEADMSDRQHVLADIAAFVRELIEPLGSPAQ